MANNFNKKEWMSGKTVLFILDEYLIGGVTTYVSVVSKKIIEMGGKVIILAFSHNLDDPQKTFPNCELMIINQKPNYKLMGRILDLISYVRKLNQIFDKHKINIIHFSTTWSAIYTFFCWKSWVVKKVSTFHGSYYLESEYFDPYERKFLSQFIRKETHFLRKLIKKKLQVFSLKKSDKIHVLSNYSKKLLLEKMDERLSSKIVVDGCVADFYPERKAKKYLETRRKNNYKHKKIFKILNFGRAEERKGIKILLQACSILQDSYNDFEFELTIATPATDEFLRIFQEYERLNLYKRVKFLHKIDSNKKIELILESDVFIMPSLDLETFGLTIVECLSFGLPVIGSNNSAILEILKMVDEKLLFETANPKDLAEKIYWFSELSANEAEKIRKKSLSASQSLNIRNSKFFSELYK